MGSATQVELLAHRAKKLCFVWFVQSRLLIRSLPLSVLTLPQLHRRSAGLMATVSGRTITPIFPCIDRSEA